MAESEAAYGREAMRIRPLSSRLVHLVLVPALLLELAQACGGDDSSGSDGTGGTSGGSTGGKSSGGTSGKGGSTSGGSNSGGKTGTGGTVNPEGGSETMGGSPGEGGSETMGGSPTTAGAGGEPSSGGTPATGGSGGDGGAGAGPVGPSKYQMASGFDSASVVASSTHFKMIATLGEGLGSASAPGKSAQLSSAHYKLATGITVSNE